MLDKKLLASIKAAPLCTIRGVTGVNAASGAWWQGMPKGSQELFVTFEVWRIDDGPIENSRLTMRIRGKESQYQAFRNSIPNYAVMEVRGRMVKLRIKANHQGIMTKKPMLAKDKELQAIAQELSGKVTYADPVFGKLTLDRGIDWFEGKAKWGKLPITLNVDAPPPHDPSKQLAIAHQLWKQQSKWMKKSLDLITSEYLDLYNKTWRLEEHPVLKAAQFRKRFKLESVHIREDNSIALWFNDDNLFAGHSLEVTGTLKKGPTDAALQG